jgi:hypothetical protein
MHKYLQNQRQDKIVRRRRRSKRRRRKENKHRTREVTEADNGKHVSC